MKRRDLILKKTGGLCFYCGCELGNKWDADHFHPVIRHPTTGKMLIPELDVIDNLVPSCKPCNNFKHSSNLEGFRWLVSSQFENVPKNSTGMRQLMRLGLVDINKKPVVFWFEKSGISPPLLEDMLQIPDEARSIEWKKDNSEPSYFYCEFDDGICSLRHLGSYWICIYKGFDWSERGRIEIQNSTERVVKLLAAKWASQINKSN